MTSFCSQTLKIRCVVSDLKPEAAVETFRTLISEVTVLEWKKCFENWFERMQKYIDLKGEYLKKQ